MRIAALVLVSLSVPVPTTAAEYQTLTNSDIASVGGPLLGAITLHAFQDDLAPYSPRLTSPNAFDRRARSSLLWQEERTSKAALASDLILFGGLFPAAVATPYIVGGDLGGPAMAIVQAVAITDSFTQLTKFAVARQRPYRTFDTGAPRGSDDNLSFVSGHTSNAFAIATASAVILQHQYGNRRSVIWPAMLVPAVTVGYLRIASDRHYLSDVLAGAILGAAIGYTTARTWIVEAQDIPDKPMAFGTTIRF